jgi:hypothetical protein
MIVNNHCHILINDNSDRSLKYLVYSNAQDRILGVKSQYKFKS